MWLIFMIWMQCKSYGQFGAIIFWTDSYFQEKVHPHSLTHHKIYWNRRDHLINIFMYVIDFIMCKRKGELSGFVRLLSCYTPVAGRAIYIQLPYNCLKRCIYKDHLTTLPRHLIRDNLQSLCHLDMFWIFTDNRSFCLYIIIWLVTLGLVWMFSLFFWNTLV